MSTFVSRSNELVITDNWHRTLSRPAEPKKILNVSVSNSRMKFYHHTSILMWKSYLQRQRRWRLLVIETLCGMLLFIIAIFIAKPVFLTPLEKEPEEPLTTADLLASMNQHTILGYAPGTAPYDGIMDRAADLLRTSIVRAKSESALNLVLYKKSRAGEIKIPVIWVIWKPTIKNQWQFCIRNSERARDMGENTNPHLRAGFLAVQVAVSQAIVEHTATTTTNFELRLVAMPVSPLMDEYAVRRALSLILMCYTLAFLPAVLETEALVVLETENMFKRASRMRSVGYSSMYLSWLVYTYLTALPVCMLGAIMLILTFRWIHLVTALLVEFAYITVMAMVALIMAMFHNQPHIACVWTTLFTLLQTYLAELLIHHEYDSMYVGLRFLLQLALPPLGLINALNDFALLTTEPSEASALSGILYMMASWGCLIMIYFAILLLLQRTIGRQRAIGGQVSWKSIIFKRTEQKNHVVQGVPAPTRSERGRVQEVEELVARAISFRDVCKDIMGHHVLQNITFDIMRGEYTILFTEKIQEVVLETLDDLITGLAVPDSGEVYVLGKNMSESPAPLNKIYMVGYCHRSDTLVDDLTVHEHFALFSAMCLWHQEHSEYSHIRYKHLLKECNLRDVRYIRVRDLDVYYRAQLCWALAMLLEPRVIIIPTLSDEPTYRAVITDKIMKFRNHIAIVSLEHSSVQLQYADRIFVFNNNSLVFGGTPGYMFFRHGREYQLRLTLRVGNVIEPSGSDDNELFERAKAAGASVRGHLGSMLILRIPPIPTANVAEFINDLTVNSYKYGLLASSINISVPDFEEVVRRAVQQSKILESKSSPRRRRREDIERANNAIKRLHGLYCESIELPNFLRIKSLRFHFRQILWKFVRFHLYHKRLFILTLIMAFTSGLLLGLSLSSTLVRISEAESNYQMYKNHILSVEFLEKPTILLIRADISKGAQHIADAYVMSDTNATAKAVEHMSYVALPHRESFVEYLMTRAIDSPQHYVYNYAYGMDVSSRENDIIVQALYSPFHHDSGAAARSIARVFMALIRHYSRELDATIQVEDKPLTLDLSPWMTDLARPPLFLQFLLILTISHILILPSMEHGMIRHAQKHATNFSPALYWLTLYLCDLIFFWLLVAFMTIVMITIICITVPQSLYQYYDFYVLPAMLLLYGVGCAPQAYVFSLGPRVAINIMAFIIVNLVFCETTLVTRLLYGNALSCALSIMGLSPQFNIAYAFVKIRHIFLYNVECVLFESQNLCATNAFHKCCDKCGVLQKCYSRKNYFDSKDGIMFEVAAMIVTAIFFSAILLLCEYKIFQLLWLKIRKQLISEKTPIDELQAGTIKVVMDVTEKIRDIESKRNRIKANTFGEYLCVSNISETNGTQYSLRNIYLGLGKGEILAISGLKRHGRLRLCKVLAGYKLMCKGSAWVMSKYRLDKDPHQYSRNVSISCEETTLPPWMTLTDALVMMGVLRGLPIAVAKKDAVDYIEALELSHLSNELINNLKLNDRTRVFFAAAVIGAPPLIILDEVVAEQKYSARRAIYSILYLLKRRGHAILTTSSNIESHMPVTHYIAFMIDGVIYDMDTIDNLEARYSQLGFTVVVHLKDEVNVIEMFGTYFDSFTINDSSDVLVNVQIFDSEIAENCNIIFQKMEALAKAHHQVYSYIITDMTIDHIFSTLVVNEKGLKPVTGFLSWRWAKKIISSKPKKVPTSDEMAELIPFEKKFDITSLIGLPWSVIFHSGGENDNNIVSIAEQSSDRLW